VKKFLFILTVSSMGFCGGGKQCLMKRGKESFRSREQKSLRMNHERDTKRGLYKTEEKKHFLKRSLLEETDSVNQISFLTEGVSLHESDQTFSNCCGCFDCSDPSSCSCIESTFSASSNSASLTTPKMITGQLNSPVPSGSCFYVKCDVPQGSSGIALGLTNLSTSTTPQPLVKGITSPFSDENVPITYVFCSNICLSPQQFEKTFTLSIVDDNTMDLPPVKSQ
jgi:hypothetical protein